MLCNTRGIGNHSFELQRNLISKEGEATHWTQNKFTSKLDDRNMHMKAQHIMDMNHVVLGE